MKRIALFAVLLFAGVASAQPPAGFRGGIPMDTVSSIPIDYTWKPAYLTPVEIPVFTTHIMRIANTPGAALMGSQWGKRARHVYSKQQPWNVDETVAVLGFNHDPPSGSSTRPVILDGATVGPVYFLGSNYQQERYDYRWTMDTSYGNTKEQVNMNSAGTQLSRWNVPSDQKEAYWNMPIGFIAYSIGGTEGNLTANNRYVALWDTNAVENGAERVLIVDMQSNVVGAPYSIPWTGLRASNVSLSPSGAFLDVKYGGDYDEHRIFDVDLVNRVVTGPHAMAEGSLRCQGRGADGWIFPLKHADMAVDPSDGNADIIIGGRTCSVGYSAGRVAKVKLATGAVTPLSGHDPDSEAHIGWISTRNTALPGWAYVTYGYVQGDYKRFNGEIVAWKTDGSGKVMRFAHYHSANSYYYDEPHAVPSPTGTRIMFASTWNEVCPSGGCGANDIYQGYVIDARYIPPPPDDPPYEIEP